MAVPVPFVREMAFRYGEAEEVLPGVRRIVARNPSLFTLHGTNTYLVGRGRVVVIDPGPAAAEHRAALRRALAGEVVVMVLVTHRHRDHAEAARGLADEVAAPVAGAAAPALEALPGALEESVAEGFEADAVLAAGDRVEAGAWTLEVVATPGHTSDHLGFALPAARALFTGDHVMGWSTSVVIPPDGDMRAYMASLRLLLARDDRVLLPGHGPQVTAPRPYLEALLAHREERETAILAALRAGPASIPAIVSAVYADVDPRLHGAAGLSVLAHLQALAAEGRVAVAGSSGLDAVYRRA